MPPEVDLNLPGPVFPKQAKWARAVLSGGPKLKQALAAGGWGAGKTFIATTVYLLVCLMNPWRKEYGASHPQSVIIAPTNAVLHDTIIKTLNAIVPTALIAHRRKAPYWSMTLINGHQILAKTADGELDGLTLCALYAEEIANDIYWRDPLKWGNYVSRCRDPNSPMKRVIAAGLPTAGSVREAFDRPGVDVQLFSAYDNPALGRDVLEQAKAVTPAGMEDGLIKGNWMQPVDALFQKFDASLHVKDNLFNPMLPTHIAIDAGNHSAIVWFQNSNGELHIIDDANYLGISVEDLCYHAENRGWHLCKESVVCVDPTLRRDETNSIKRALGTDARIFKRNSQHPLYFVPEGIRVMQAGLLNAKGETRFYIDRRCMVTKNGVVRALQTARTRHQTGTVIKNDADDHLRDCARYAACYVLADLARGPKTGRVK